MIGRTTSSSPCPNNSLPVFNYSFPNEIAQRNPFVNFDFSKDIPNLVLRAQLASNPEKHQYYFYKIYGVHKRFGFTRQQWRNFKNYWTTNKVAPSNPTTGDNGDE